MEALVDQEKGPNWGRWCVNLPWNNFELFRNQSSYYARPNKIHGGFQAQSPWTGPVDPKLARTGRPNKRGACKKAWVSP